MAGRRSWLAHDGSGVALFMRIEGQREILVGRARAMRDIPGLLRTIADQWQVAADADVLYEPPGQSPPAARRSAGTASHGTSDG